MILGVIFGRFLNADNFRPEVDSDVKSDGVVDQTGVKNLVIQTVFGYTTASLSDERR